MSRKPSRPSVSGQLRVPWVMEGETMPLHETADEQRFAREQASKSVDRRAAQSATQRPNGTRFRVLAERRCARCQHWSHPSVVKPPKHVPVNVYGDCQVLIVLDRRVGDYEKGQVLGEDELEEVLESGSGWQVSYDDLRTMATFGCQAFASVSWLVDPDADLTDEARIALLEAA